MLSVNEILTKLGMAFYLHKARIKEAQAAKEAVEYLAEMGVFAKKSGTAAEGK